MYKTRRSAGFTLIELSIVLVIIGLVIGAVLTGRDLIRAAGIRSAITQVEEYQTIVNTFRIKYNAVPGDVTDEDAIAVGFVRRFDSGHGTGVIHGNGLIEATSDDIVNDSARVAGYEPMLFWSDLSDVQLVSRNFSEATDTMVAALVLGQSAREQVDKHLPALSGLETNYVTVFSTGGINYFQLTGVTSVSAGSYGLDYQMTPGTANNIDTKIDDGLPLSGIVRGSRSTTQLGIACDPSANANNGDPCCGDSAGGNANQYQLTPDLVDVPACQLRVKFQ